MTIQRAIQDRRVLEQWLTTLLQREDVCTTYKVNAIRDVLTLMYMELQPQSNMEQPR